jgi:nitrate reductase molybdenum cofactor assembly chaperone NarJ/NarW
MTRVDHRAAWQAQSLLLGYPDETLAGQYPLLRRVAAQATEPVGAPLVAFIDKFDHNDLSRSASEYVATFDQRKRNCLYLTYYAYGDTRRRGMALLALKQTYAAAGMRLVEDELPDHLAVVLEYLASQPDPGTGEELLEQYRAGIELLRLGLHEAASPWALVLDSVCATLAPLRGEQHEIVARLAAEGPPDEQVGLAPFTAPDYLLLGPTNGGRR